MMCNMRVWLVSRRSTVWKVLTICLAARAVSRHFAVSTLSNRRRNGFRVSRPQVAFHDAYNKFLDEAMNRKTVEKRDFYGTDFFPAKSV